MKTDQTFAINFWLYKSKANQGKAPIYCRITINSLRTEIAVKRKIEPAKWNSNAGNVRGQSEEARTINHYLELVRTELFRIYNHFLITQTKIHPQDLKNAFLGVKEEQRGLLDVFQYHNDQMKNLIGIEVVKSTHTKFETVKGKLETFIQKKLNKKNLLLEELSNKFIIDFEYFLKVDEKIAHNTAMKYIRNVKKVMNMAVANEWLSKNPFDNFKCSSKKVNREILTQQDLQKLTEKDIQNQRLDEVRDIFLFCCYTGYAFIDVYNLEINDVVVGIDGKKWIHTNRQKTGNTSNVPLLPPAQRIIEKYNSHSCQSENLKLLPVKSNQKMNVYLKELADICDINKKMTMHIARHTFATTVTLANDVPIETVSKMLGHTKLATTQIYAQVLDTKIGQDMQKLAKLFEKQEVKLNKMNNVS